MTCDFCFDTKHWKCRGNCGCSVCGRGATPPRRVAEKVRVKAKPKPRDRKGEHAKYYKSAVPDEQRRLRNKLGVLTRFSPDEVERIFEGKSQGRSISELAREFRTTRDKIRTVYNCPAAPEYTPVEKPIPTKGSQRFTTIREEFDGEVWRVVYKSRWANLQ